MQEIWNSILAFAPDMAIYAAIVLVTVFSAVRCYRPVRRNSRALRRATRVVIGESELKLARPSWNDVNFLGAGLQSEWARFLQNAELMDSHNEPCDVEDYVNIDTVIYNAANTQLADLTPGVLVSLGILGTFLGIVTAMRGVRLSATDTSLAIESIEHLMGGMYTAFLTSICGIIASLIFNFGNRYTISQAQRALNRFLPVFQQYVMPRPADTQMKMLAMQQEQNAYLRTFVEEVTVRTATQIEQAILRALLPVQRSMDNFIVAATREQVEGMDRIAARFIERMNLSLDGQFMKLGDTLSSLNAHHQHTQADLQASAAAISTVTQEVVQMQREAQEMFAQWDLYLQHMQAANSAAEESGAHSAELLENMHAASMQQAKYLAKLQEYQAELQSSVQQYTLWADKFLGSTERQTEMTNGMMEQVAAKMQDSAELLQSSYASFVENIQTGLARALGMLDENIGGIAKDLNNAMSGIHATVTEIPGLMASSARKYGAQVDQFVEALSQMQKSMQNVSKALAEHATQREVG